MFNCFTQLAIKDNYNYEVSYCDYEGMVYEYDYGEEGDDDWFDPTEFDDDNDSGGRRKNSGLIGWKIALIVGSLVLVKVKNNH